MLQLLEEVLELQEVERPAFLDRCCGADEAMRREIVKLLRFEREDRELSPLADEALLAEVAGGIRSHLDPGSRVAGYVVRRVVATGGMGVVYEAEQKRPARRVALKLMRWVHDSESSRRRFRYEAEFLARLSHPGIAQVYEVGVHHAPDGTEVPFFAMEFVDGSVDLVTSVRQRALDREERLQLFQKICQAVHHGHQRGVIHRDLKPSNILVDREGSPKIIDFGIARATEVGDATRQTAEGNLLGTLDYMSPEQLGPATVAVDTRSDVYALGVLLYELLCGRTPHQTADCSIPEAVRRVTETEPPRPSTMVQLPRDLEAVVLKALARDPSKRYASADALSQDVGRFLDLQPVDARLPSKTYQLTRLVQRHRALAIGTAILLIGLTAALLVSLAATRTARQATAAAKFQLGEAARAQAAEARTRQHAEQLTDELLSLSTEYVFSFASEMKRIEGTNDVRLRMIDRTIQHLKRLEAQAGRPEIRTALAGAHLEMGDLLGHPDMPNLGDPEAAKERYENAAQLASQAHQEEPTETNLLGWSKALMRLGEAALAEGTMTVAVDYFEQSLKKLEATGSEGRHPVQLAQLLTVLGSAHGVSGKHKAALECFQRVRHLRVAMLEETPNDLAARFNVGNSTAKVSAAQYQVGDLERAIVTCEQSLEILTDLVEDAPRHITYRVSLAQAHSLLSEILIASGDPEYATETALTGIDVIQPAVETHPEDVFAIRWNAPLWFNLGWSYQEREQATEDARESEILLRQAADAYEQSREIFESLHRRGALLGREAGHLAIIAERIDEVRERLEELRKRP